MASGLGTLTVWLNADTSKFRRGMFSARQALKSFAAMAGLGGAGYMIQRFVRSAVSDFMSLDDAMAKSMAILPGVGNEVRADLQKTAEEMSKRSLFSATELAKGYFYLFSAGKNVAQSQRLLGDVAKFAQAGQFDLSLATTLLADSQKALGLSSLNVAEDQKSMARVSDVLVKANTLANANVQQFAESLQNEAAPAMRAFGVDLEEGVAVLAAYADQGTKGAEAGSQFGRFLRLLVPSANENKEAFKKLGIEVFNAEGNLRSMVDITADITNALSGMSVSEKSAALETLGFQKKMQQVVFPLLGASERIKEYEAALRKASGTTGKVAERQMQSLGAQIQLVKQNLSLAAAELLSFETAGKSAFSMIQDFGEYMKSGAMVFEIKSMAISFSETFQKIQFVLSSVGENLASLFAWIQSNWSALWENNAAVIRAFGKDFLTLWFKLSTFPLQMLRAGFSQAGGAFKPFNDLLDNVKDNVAFMRGNISYDEVLKREETRQKSYAGSGSLAEGMKTLFTDTLTDIFKDVGVNTEQAMKKAGITGPKLMGLEDIGGEWDKISAKADQSRENLFAKTMKRYGIAVPGGAAGGKAAPLPGEPKAEEIGSRRESSVVQAVQRGSVEALRAENIRTRKDTEIVNNTKRTADATEKLVQLLPKLAVAGGDEYELDEVF